MTGLAESVTVTVSSKGQITLPSKMRKQLKIAKGEKLLLVSEDGAIKLVPIPKLSELAGVDEELFKGRNVSEELFAMRREWGKEDDERIKKL